MKKIEIDKDARSRYTKFRLGTVTIKEIIKKYPDKVIDVYTEGKNAVMVLDTCRIKFVNTQKEGAEDGKK